MDDEKDTEEAWREDRQRHQAGKTLTRDLIPDQLYGIEYLTDEGPRYRFFVVEVERGTNPKTSKQDRKSVERMKAMYGVYIGQGKYKEHLKLRAPLVLSDCSYHRTAEESLRPKDSTSSHMLYASDQSFTAF